MHPYPGNWMAIERAVVCHAWATRAFSAGIKCRHCMFVYCAYLYAVLAALLCSYFCDPHIHPFG